MDENALRWLMNTEEGRQVVFGILELAGVYRTDFSSDENTNLYLAGRRSIGTDLLQEIRRLEQEGTVNEDGLALEYRMLREAKERAERAKREAEEKDIFE
jgi:hypothetical protein